MRGRGGCDRAFQAEEGPTSLQCSEPRARPSHPKPAGGSPLFHEVLPAEAGAAGQEGNPEGGVQFSDIVATCQQSSTNSGPLAFSSHHPAERQIQKQIGLGRGSVREGFLEVGAPWAGS